MKTHLIKSFIALALLSCIAINSYATECPSTNVVIDPYEFKWVHHPVSESNSEAYYSGTLEMGEASFVIDGETLTTRAYRQEGQEYAIPGPTIIMEPGNKYVLRFKNTLDYQPLVQDHNIFKDPNVTNVHTHGVHISGETPADDVTRWFEGGFGGDYVYEIPADHMGGTYWYHAHHHGSTFLQVSSGAFGLMLIDDVNDDIPSNVADMTEKQIVMGFLEPAAASGTGGDTLISGSFSAGWTTNGKVNGNICMPNNEWQHWRMLVADQDARLVDLEIGSQCEVALMARDGVWRTEVPEMISTNKLTLTGASRVDLAVRCNADSSITLAGSQIAQVYVDGGGNTGVHPYAVGGTAEGGEPWTFIRPAYLADLRGLPVDDSDTIRMGARSVLGRKFDAEIPNLIKNANGIQEWKLKGATNHPFHLHIYHVQVMGDCGPYEDGEYYDVIAGGCTVRFMMDPSTAYEGRTILHCHILTHEDQGAMAWMDVIGGEPPPVFPVNSDILLPYSTYYAVGGDPGTEPAAPTGLSATTQSSSAIDLAWIDNSGNETGFEIERSTDGLSFAPIATTVEDVTVFSDSGLASSTTYYYRVLAFNNNGDSTFSDTSSATTDDTAGSGTAVEAGSINVSTINLGRGVKQGQVDIIVVDDQGTAVAEAVVRGEFTGDLSESATSTGTDGSGSTTITTAGSTKPLNSLTFCVTSISHPDLRDFSGNDCGSL